MKSNVSGLSLGLAMLLGVLGTTGCEGMLTSLFGEDGLSASTEPALPEPSPGAPLSGGTLAVSADGVTAVAADSEMDRVFVVDLEAFQIRHEVVLKAKDEPGRVAMGKDGVAYVALRRGGAVAAVNLASGEVSRRDVCGAPRGLAYDSVKDVLHVACAGGELVSLAGNLEGEPLRSLRLERDLRDVVIRNDALVVSRFRAAELLIVNGEGVVEKHLKPGVYASPTQRTFEPAVGWRMLDVPGGSVVMVHQRSFTGTIPTGAPLGGTGATYYGGPCDNSVVHAALTAFDVEGGFSVTMEGKGGLGNLTLPVDVAVSKDGRVAVVGAGMDSVLEAPLSATTSSDTLDTCPATALGPTGSKIHSVPDPVAAAFGVHGYLLVQGRQELLTVFDAQGKHVGHVSFPSERRLHTGDRLFHKAPGGGNGPVACASCHPEGREDGRVWKFEKLGELRSQSMLGGVLDTLPLHWEGDMDNIDALISEVFVNRMGAAEPSEHERKALAEWMDSLPALPAVKAVDAEAAARGSELFYDAKVGCGNCHSGNKLTNNATMDVGTGRALQVPSLIGVADRLPLMHTGCAKTLKERFDPACGGGDQHGVTSHLSEAQLSDLIVYLETL